MKSISRVRLYLATAALALASGGCATMAPQAERYVAPPLGSTWTYAQRDTGSYGSGAAQVTQTSTEHVWQGKLVRALVSAQGAILVDSDGAWPAQLAPDGKPIFSWIPPIGFDFPLAVGKTWTRSYRVTLYATHQSFAFESTWKVVAYEDLTVPAGTFKAFKISMSTNSEQENTYWFVPQLGINAKQIWRREARSRFGPGTRELELVSQNITK